MITLIKRKSINPQTKEEIYYSRWTRVSTVTETQLAKRMARGSTFSVGEVNGVFVDVPTAEGQQDAEGEETPDSGTGTTPTIPEGGDNTGGGSTNPTPDPDGGSDSDE